MTHRFTQRLQSLVSVPLVPLVAALVACGGGGGDDASPGGGGEAVAWSAQAYVKAANAQAGDFFGLAIAIDGDTLVVGTPFEDSSQTTITNGTVASADNSAPNSGAAYVYVRNPATNTWSQQAYLKAPNAEAGDSFGTSVAISGNTIVVGAVLEASNQTTITQGTGASSSNGAAGSGAAYVFVRNSGDNSWNQQAYLKASNANVNDSFGGRVAISGDTIVVGARFEDSNQTTITNGPGASVDNEAVEAGAAYVFVRNVANGAWSQQAYLKAPNAQDSDVFGGAVAIDGDTIVVGAAEEDSGQTTITNGSGASADNRASNAGAAYVFVRSPGGNTWSHQAYLKAPNAEARDSFGGSVGISGNTIVVGASNESSNQTTVTNGATVVDNNAETGAGAVYVFVRSASNNTWSHQAYLKAPNAQAGDEFGRDVAISGDTIVVGAGREDSSQITISQGTGASTDNSAGDAGAAYVFVRRTADNTWSQQAYLKAPNAGPGDLFARLVAVSGRSVVVGAIGESANQNTITNGNSASADNSAAQAGAAYVFVRN